MKEGWRGLSQQLFLLFDLNQQRDIKPLRPCQRVRNFAMVAAGNAKTKKEKHDN